MANTPLIQIAVLPKQVTDGTFSYSLIGLDADGNVWKRQSTAQGWVKDTATFENN